MHRPLRKKYGKGNPQRNFFRNIKTENLRRKCFKWNYVSTE